VSRESSIDAARAYLGEARNRRRHPANRDFYWRLLAWARNARLRAAACRREPEQGGLFA
jgi:hypothetical protein